MSYFVAGLLVGLLICGLIYAYRWWKDKPVREKLTELEAKTKINEVIKDYENSLDTKIPVSNSGKLTLLKRFMGNK